MSDTHGTVGVWGERDPECPCSMYAPTITSLLHRNGRLGIVFSAPGEGDCMGDGHYLCGECMELSRESPLFPVPSEVNRG